MREESHLNDMRAAIRGDFERLAKRRGTQELMHGPVEAEPEPPANVDPEPPGGLGVRPHGPDPAADPEVGAEPALEREADPAAEPEPEPEPVAEPAPHEERRRAPAPPPAAPEVVSSVEVEADDAGAEPEIEEPPKRGFFARLLGL